MLPPLSLRDVSRDDVDRVSWWLEDSEISSRWFGHYACGDPIHRGYDPQQMLEATESDWKRVFGDPQRLIYSIYTDSAEHIGEAQLLLDGKEGAELSLLIGRKDLWHHGYGNRDGAPPARQGLRRPAHAESLGQHPRRQCAGPRPFHEARLQPRRSHAAVEGPVQTSRRLVPARQHPLHHRRTVSRPPALHEAPRAAMARRDHHGHARQPVGAIAREVARALKSRYVDDDQIREALQGRLRCSSGELDAFEASHRSRWTRALASMAMPITGVGDTRWATGRTPPTPPTSTSSKIS